jgi:hypothetical protein
MLWTMIILYPVDGANPGKKGSRRTRHRVRHFGQSQATLPAVAASVRDRTGAAGDTCPGGLSRLRSRRSMQMAAEPGEET